MNDTANLLQIKIEEAKRQLPLETVNAISAIPWQASILKMRETKGYTFEQLGELETDTEMVLCGLLLPENYPRELEKNMGITKSQAMELVNYMNQEVFSRIRAELIKNTERKKRFAESSITPPARAVANENAATTTPPPTQATLEEENKAKEEDTHKMLNEVGIKIIPAGTRPIDLSILNQKLSSPVQTGVIKTEHTVENITKVAPASVPAAAPSAPISTGYPKNDDPYRVKPE